MSEKYLDIICPLAIIAVGCGFYYGGVYAGMAIIVISIIIFSFVKIAPASKGVGRRFDAKNAKTITETIELSLTSGKLCFSDRRALNPKKNTVILSGMEMGTYKMEILLMKNDIFTYVDSLKIATSIQGGAEIPDSLEVPVDTGLLLIFDADALMQGADSSVIEKETQDALNYPEKSRGYILIKDKKDSVIGVAIVLYEGDDIYKINNRVEEGKVIVSVGEFINKANDPDPDPSP